MPNYDLHCIKCNIDFNTQASMKEKSENKIPCPTCGSFDLKTIFRAPPGVVKSSSKNQCPQRSTCGGCQI